MRKLTRIAVFCFLFSVFALALWAATDVVPKPGDAGNLGQATNAWPVVYATNVTAASITLGGTEKTEWPAGGDGFPLADHADGNSFAISNLSAIEVEGDADITGTLRIEGQVVASSGAITVVGGNVEAAQFYGDGSSVSNVHALTVAGTLTNAVSNYVSASITSNAISAATWQLMTNDTGGTLPAYALTNNQATAVTLSNTLTVSSNATFNMGLTNNVPADFFFVVKGEGGGDRIRIPSADSEAISLTTDVLSVSGSQTNTGNMGVGGTNYAAYFVGDGSGLTGISGSGSTNLVDRPNNLYVTNYVSGSNANLTVSGTTTNTGAVQMLGALDVDGGLTIGGQITSEDGAEFALGVTAASFTGDGSGLTNLVGSTGSSNLVDSAYTLVVTNSADGSNANLTVSGDLNVTGSATIGTANFTTLVGTIAATNLPPEAVTNSFDDTLTLDAGMTINTGDLNLGGNNLTTVENIGANTITVTTSIESPAVDASSYLKVGSASFYITNDAAGTRMFDDSSDLAWFPAETSGTNADLFLGPLAGTDYTDTNLTDNNVTNYGSATFIGMRAGRGSTAGRPTFIGHAAGEYASQGDYGTFVGFAAGLQSTNAPRTTILGYRAGGGGAVSNAPENVLIGHEVSRFSKNIGTNVFIGSRAGKYSSNVFNSIIIGADLDLTNVNGQVVLGGGAITNTYLYGNVTVASNLTVETEAYDATGWNGDLTVPTKDAVRDKIETLAGGFDITSENDGSDTGVLTNMAAVYSALFSGPLVGNATMATNATYATNLVNFPVDIGLACSGPTNNLTTVTGAVTFVTPFAFTLTNIMSSLTMPVHGSTLNLDLNTNGTTIISGTWSHPTGAYWTNWSAFAMSNIAAKTRFSVDIDQIGSTTNGIGLKVWLQGYR